MGREPSVIDPVHQAMKRACKYLKDSTPTSLMFGYERARMLGFMDAVIDEAGTESYLLPQGKGKPFNFGPWVSIAAEGALAEPRLNDRIKKVWKTDIFLSSEDELRYLAATIKSNYAQLEGGAGLRVGIVPESTHYNNRSGVKYDNKSGLWLVTLADPNGFMGLFNDGYHAVARSMCTLGKQQAPYYYAKPSAKAQKVQEQLQKYPDAKVLEIEFALNEAAQQNLVNQSHKLVDVNAPDWLHLRSKGPKIISPKPSFAKLD